MGNSINVSDFLTFVGLFFAYLAYCWSIESELNSLKSVIQSANDELNAQRQWYDGEYKKDTFNNTEAYLPTQKHLPLSFFALPELIKRGASGKEGVSKKLIENLSIFLERVATYNSYLEDHRLIATSDPLSSKKVVDILSPLIKTPETFNKKIAELKTKDVKLYSIAADCFSIKKILHERVIADGNTEDGLYFLYGEIKKNLNLILNDFEANKPFFIRYKIQIVAASVLTFLYLEFFNTHLTIKILELIIKLC